MPCLCAGYRREWVDRQPSSCRMAACPSSSAKQWVSVLSSGGLLQAAQSVWPVRCGGQLWVAISWNILPGLQFQRAPMGGKYSGRLLQTAVCGCGEWVKGCHMTITWHETVVYRSTALLSLCVCYILLVKQWMQLLLHTVRMFVSGKLNCTWFTSL